MFSFTKCDRFNNANTIIKVVAHVGHVLVINMNIVHLHSTLLTVMSVVLFVRDAQIDDTAYMSITL